MLCCGDDAHGSTKIRHGPIRSCFQSHSREFLTYPVRSLLCLSSIVISFLNDTRMVEVFEKGVSLGIKLVEVFEKGVSLGIKLE